MFQNRSEVLNVNCFILILWFQNNSDKTYDGSKTTDVANRFDASKLLKLLNDTDTCKKY